MNKKAQVITLGKSPILSLRKVRLEAMQYAIAVDKTRVEVEVRSMLFRALEEMAESIGTLDHGK